MIKRGLTIFLALILCLMPFVTVSASSDKSSQCYISVGIYNAVSNEYILNNKTLAAPQGLSIQNSIALLKREGFILDFIQESGSLKSLTYLSGDEKKVINENGNMKFHVKLNGMPVSNSALTQTIAEGDIIEWIFATDQDYQKANKHDISSNETSSVKASTEFWSEKMAKVMDEACSWLDLNSDHSDSYLIAIGSAGKPANVDVVNSLLAKLDQTESYASPSEISRRIMMLAFCGYDVGNANVKDLLSKLMEFQNITVDGAAGLAGTLMAYDCRGYSVPHNVLNNRGYVVEKLLEMQASNGSFPHMDNQIDDIESTSLVVAALSNYMENAKVKTAVEKAVSYFTTQKQVTTSKNISNLMIAFSSIGISLENNPFCQDKKPLWDLLIQYQNDDGGFSQNIGGQSDTISTERAVIALSAVKRNANPFKIFGSVDAAFIISKEAVPKNNTFDFHNMISYIELALIILCFFVDIFRNVLKKRMKTKCLQKKR